MWDMQKYPSKNHAEELLQDSLPTISFSIPNTYLQAMEDRIVERLIEKLVPFLQTERIEDDLLTIEEASAFLKKSKAQIYQWVNNARHGIGDFPYLKSGRSLRFSKKALIGWLEKNAKKR